MFLSKRNSNTFGGPTRSVSTYFDLLQSVWAASLRCGVVHFSRETCFFQNVILTRSGGPTRSVGTYFDLLQSAWAASLRGGVVHFSRETCFFQNVILTRSGVPRDPLVLTLTYFIVLGQLRSVVG